MQFAKKTLFGKTLSQIESVVEAAGFKRSVAKSIACDLYRRGICVWDDMTTVSPDVKERLSSDFCIGVSAPVNVLASDDGVRKYLFQSAGGGRFETVYIPEQDRHTLCVSTQVGCRMGCMFCMTGKQGFQAQLTTGEIINQIRSIPERHLLTNIVYMGMGEPFDNLEAVMNSIEILTSHYGFNIPPRRITVSTAGITKGVKIYLENAISPLAVSLHSPFKEERRRLMPVENASPLHEVLETIRRTPISSQRRIFFEYIVFKDLNHSQRHADELARLLCGIRCRINLMRFHPVPGIALESPDDDEIMAFRAALEEKGFFTSIRRSRGQDISAACGLLCSQDSRGPATEFTTGPLP